MRVLGLVAAIVAGLAVTSGAIAAGAALMREQYVAGQESARAECTPLTAATVGDKPYAAAAAALAGQRETPSITVGRIWDDGGRHPKAGYAIVTATTKGVGSDVVGTHARCSAKDSNGAVIDVEDVYFFDLFAPNYSGRKKNSQSMKVTFDLHGAGRVAHVDCRVLSAK